MLNSPALYKYCTYGGMEGRGAVAAAWLDQGGSEGEKKNMTNNTPHPDKRALGETKASQRWAPDPIARSKKKNPRQTSLGRVGAA